MASLDTWLLLNLVATYACSCVVRGVRSDAPLWWRWPFLGWEFIRRGGRRPRPQPDYAKIARLERELGFTNVDSGQSYRE